MKEGGTSEAAPELGPTLPHSPYLCNPCCGRHMAGQPGWNLQNECLPGKFDVRDRARMEMEPQENLSSVHRVGRAHCCGESREILVKADVSQVHLGK